MDAVCKGSYLLGTACGMCPKCDEEFKKYGAIGVDIRRTALTNIVNGVYAVVIEALAPFESRGFNSHQRAQAIAEQAKQQAKDWIEKQ